MQCNTTTAMSAESWHKGCGVPSLSQQI